MRADTRVNRSSVGLQWVLPTATAEELYTELEGFLSGKASRWSYSIATTTPQSQAPDQHDGTGAAGAASSATAAGVAPASATIVLIRARLNSKKGKFNNLLSWFAFRGHVPAVVVDGARGTAKGRSTVAHNNHAHWRLQLHALHGRVAR